MKILVEQTIEGLLETKQWPAIAHYFSLHAPSSALEFKARALQHIHLGKDSASLQRAAADFEEACRRAPADAVNWINLAQCQLDIGQADAAFASAMTAFKTAPTFEGAVAKLVLTSFATGRQDLVLPRLREVRDELARAGNVPLFMALVIADLESQWWKPLSRGSLTLRKMGPTDEAFLTSVYRDRDFMSQYNVFQDASDRSIREFLNKTQLSPLQSGRIDWIVLDGDQPIGVTSLSNIDFRNRRADFMGGAVATLAGIKKVNAAKLAIEFAFTRLNLHKLCSYVYVDNPVAQKFTLGLGFHEEGRLRKHVFLGEGRGWVDLQVNGLLSGEEVPATH